MKFYDDLFFKKKLFINLFLIIIISLITSKIFFQYHIINFDDIILRFENLLKGYPDWKTYQNRLLGPIIIEGINLVLNNYKNSFILFLLFFIFLNNILFYISLNNKLDEFNKIFILLLFNFFFLFFQHHFIYPWDLIELSLIILLIISLSQEKFFLKIFFIFFVALLNKESSLIMGIFLFLILILEKKFLISIFMGITIILGYFFVQFIRNYLYVDRYDGQSVDFHPLELFNNLNDLFINNLSSPRFIFTLIILGCFIYIFKNLKVVIKNTLVKYLSIIFVLYFIPLILFGIVMETRTQLVLLPIFFHIYIEIKKDQYAM